MKQLDRFSRLENATYYVWIYFWLLVGPWLMVLLADGFLLKDLPSVIRYLLWAVVGIVVPIFVLFMSAVPFENIFSTIRKTFGMKSIHEIEREISEQRKQEEHRNEQWMRDVFTSRSDAEQRFTLYLLQQDQLRQLAKIQKSVEFTKSFVVAVVGCILLVLVVSRLF